MKILILIALISCASALTVTCRYTSFATSTGIGGGNIYACQVFSVDLSDNSPEVKRIIGYGNGHLARKTNINVQGLIFPKNCINDGLTFIPKGFFKFFPNILVLISGCPIFNFDGDELDQFPKLEYFNQNFLTSTRVPSNLFNNTPNLKFVSFSNNAIEHFGEGLLDNLSKLEGAGFFNNTCIHQAADNKAEIASLITALKEKCPDKTN